MIGNEIYKIGVTSENGIISVKIFRVIYDICGNEEIYSEKDYLAVTPSSERRILCIMGVTAC